MFGSKQSVKQSEASEAVVLLLQQMLVQQKDVAEQQAVHHKELLAALRSTEQLKASALPGSAWAPIEQASGLGPVSGADQECSAIHGKGGLKHQEDLTPGLDSTMRFRKVQGLHWLKITVMNYNILAPVLIKTRS